MSSKVSFRDNVLKFIYHIYVAVHLTVISDGKIKKMTSLISGINNTVKIRLTLFRKMSLPSTAQTFCLLFKVMCMCTPNKVGFKTLDDFSMYKNDFRILKKFKTDLFPYFLYLGNIAFAFTLYLWVEWSNWFDLYTYCLLGFTVSFYSLPHKCSNWSLIFLHDFSPSFSTLENLSFYR